MSSSACATLVLLACATLAPAQSATVARDRVPPELATLTDEELARVLKMSPRGEQPPDPSNRVADDARAAELGRNLFTDTRLSPAGIACAKCHDPARAFADGLPLARGIGETRRNSPTLLDVARRRWFGWDGKFDSMWSQALSPLENPVEMGGDRTTLVRVIRDDAALRANYEAVFGAMPAVLSAREGSADPLALPARPDASALDSAHAKRWASLDAPSRDAIDTATANILKSFGAYERTLVSGPTPLDRFVAALRGEGGGDAAALPPSARRGLAMFVSSAGCYQCHRGASFTDEEFHALGLVGANGKVPDDPARLAAVDFVKANPFNLAGALSDARDTPKANMVKGLRRSGELFGQFRTPSLRSVALTAPYMHDGRFATLEDVVHFYDTLDGAASLDHHGERVLAPLGLSETQRADLVEFLRCLSPIAPESGAKTDPPAQPSRTSAPAGGNSLHSPKSSDVGDDGARS